MEHYLEQLNLTEMMEELDGFFPDASLDLWGMFERILSGEWKEAGQMAWQGLFGSIWEQVAGMKGLFVSLLILGILSVLVSCFLASFENHQIAQIALQRDYARQQLDVQLRSALNDLMTARETMFAQEKTVAQARKAYRISDTRYRAGAGTILELNSAQLAQTQAQLNYSQAIYDYLSAKAEYDRLIGREE